jgi:hypothetical protein
MAPKLKATSNDFNLCAQNENQGRAARRREMLVVRQQEVANLVEAYADRLDELRERADRAAELIPRLRCALPTTEPLN